LDNLRDANHSGDNEGTHGMTRENDSIPWVAVGTDLIIFFYDILYAFIHRDVSPIAVIVIRDGYIDKLGSIPSTDISRQIDIGVARGCTGLGREVSWNKNH
jgi:hypothetical protein